MFNPFHPLLIPPQPCIPTFFGKYSTSFQVSENQSAEDALKKNDLQVGMGTADNTGSKVEFSSMVHSMGLVNLTLGSKTVPSTRVFKPGSTSEILFDRAPTTSITATSNFTASVASNSASLRNKSTGIYLLVGKPSTTVTFTGNSSDKYTWNSTYTFSKNTGEVKTVTPSREYDNAGWGFDYTGAVQTFTAPVTGTYKLEVWGAQGGAGGGKGGYSSGNQDLNKNYSLYVCCGGAGKADTGTGYTANTQNPGGEGGYNGGGNGGEGHQSNYAWRISGGGGGGGCTHIATVNRGELYNYVNYKTEVLLVAGGGGGSLASAGGYGGGISGGSTTYVNTEVNTSYTSEGGTQTTGYMFGKGQQGMDKTVNGSGGAEGNGGGGGGWYGGLSKQVQGNGSSVGGGGGSGHVGDVTNGQTIAGNETFPSPLGGTETGHSGNGYAVITQVSY